MECTRRIAAAAVWMTTLGLMVAARAEQSEAVRVTNRGRVRALLVGVSRYDHLKNANLDGPANDVPLLADVMRERYGLQDADVVVLTEEAGKTKPAHRPTEGNIKNALVELEASTEEGDQVLIYLSGHGVQQPANDPAEVDGLDEVFLPADAQAPDKGGTTLLRTITDNDIRRALHAIDKRGAFAWLIADCCHSGSIARGLDVPRRLLPKDLFSEPVAKEVERLQGQRQAVAAPRNAAGRGLPQSAVALYASRSHEPTLERKFPSVSRPEENDVYGLLTYNLVKVLRSHRSETPLTYRELLHHVQKEYDALGYSQYPAPLIEGLGRDREVLGEAARPQVTRFELFLAGDQWKLRAGLMHGISSGSILALYPPTGSPNPDQRLGHVAIVRCGAITADVTPCVYEEAGKKWPSPADLPAGGQCELVNFNYGDLRLAVAADDPVEVGGGPDRRTLQSLLQDAGKQKEVPLTVVDEPRAAQWRLLGAKSRVFLSPVHGELKGSSEGPERLLNSFSLDDLPRALPEQLRRIARAELLRKIAKEPPFPSPRQSKVALDVELLKFRDENDQSGTPVELVAQRPRLVEGERVAFRVTNRSTRTNLYVTLLMIDSGFGIEAIYPGPGEVVEVLAPQKSFTTESFIVNAETIGAESVVALAVPAVGRPVDFTSLTQPTLAAARNLRAHRGPAGVGSNLAELLEGAFFNVPSGDGTRALRRDEMQRCATDLLTWETVARTEGN